jgi:hypothetical protein
VTILDRVFPPDQCDDAVGDRWAKSGTTLLGLWLIGGGVSSIMDDEGEVA